MKRRHFLGTLGTGLCIAPSLLQSLPQDGEQRSPAPRRRENFNAGWLFQRQARGGGALGSWDRDAFTGSMVEPRFREAHAAGYDDSSWEAVCLPHTWNAQDGCDEIPGYFRGIGWYRKHFRLDNDQRGKRIFLEFEGVNQVSEFWVNGSRVGEHKGGYTSFEFDITEHVHFGPDTNVLAVKVNNVYSPNIAPTVKTDVTFYGGIYRDVWLRVSEPVYVSTLYWRTPQVSEAAAQVDIYSTIANTAARGATLQLVHEILDAGGSVVARVSSPVEAPAGSERDAKQTIRVQTPRLWSPDAPNLYCIRTSLVEGQRPTDSVEVPLGFRWFRFDADHGFFLNGTRLQLRGTTWHQSYPGM